MEGNISIDVDDYEDLGGEIQDGFEGDNSTTGNNFALVESIKEISSTKR